MNITGNQIKEYSKSHKMNNLYQNINWTSNEIVDLRSWYAGDSNYRNYFVQCIIGNTFEENFSYCYQAQVLNFAQTAYFIAIVVSQWSNLLNCKTRNQSLFVQGIFNNNFLNFSLIFETCICIIVCYVPVLNN